MQNRSQLPEPLVASRFCWFALIALLISGGLILFINQFTQIDQRLADLYFDTALNDFPWRKSWFATTLMHDRVKYVIVGFGLLTLALTLVDAIYPIRGIALLTRMQLRIVSLSMILVPLSVSMLKQKSNIHCPWSIKRYGGSESLLRLLDHVPPGWHAGQCFPAGHASTAMWLAALAVFWLPRQPRRALAVFLCGIGAGFFLGWVQQMRGAHFLTHTLATAWIGSAIFLLVLVVVPHLCRLAHGTLLRPKTGERNARLFSLGKEVQLKFAACRMMIPTSTNPPSN